MPESIPFPPLVRAGLGRLNAEIKLLLLRRDSYAAGALAGLGVEAADIDWENCTYTPPATAARD